VPKMGFRVWPSLGGDAIDLLERVTSQVFRGFLLTKGQDVPIIRSILLRTGVTSVCGGRDSGRLRSSLR
jgi:hypothetical protein